MVQQQSNTAEVITAEVDGQRFLSHMRTLFSTTTKYLAELMQNARRAGATAVRFDVQDNSVTVIDDGVGVGEFKALIHVAVSGWDKETQEAESPFGIGFCSVVFAAEQVTVESRGKKVVLTADAVVGKEAIPVVPSDFIGSGTRVALLGVKKTPEQLCNQIKAFAYGFPIPVILNGEDLPRPHAVENLPEVQDTPVGKIYVPALKDGKPDMHLYYDSGYAYVQGLPISAGRFTANTWYGESGRPVVHVDHNVYPPRMPDRDSFIDAEQAGKGIVEAIKNVWRAQMEADKLSMSAEAFTARYWQMAFRIAPEMLADVPVLPASILEEISRYPVSTDYGSFTELYKSNVSRADVEAGRVTLLSAPSTWLSKNNWLCWLAAKELGWLLVKDIPASHWATEYVVDFEDIDVELVTKATEEREFSGAWVIAQIHLCSSIEARFEIGGKQYVVPITSAVAIGDDQWSVDIYVPATDTYHALVLEQASDYCDDNQKFEDALLDRDKDRFESLLSVMRGEDPAITLKRILGDAPTYENLVGKSFIVTFGEDCRCSSVQLAP